MKTYITGNPISDICTFTSVTTNAPVDPPTVRVQSNVWYAGNVSQTTTLNYVGNSNPAVGIIARLSTGVYEVNFDTSALPGYWWWSWTGTVPGLASIPKSAIVVTPNVIAPVGRSFGSGYVGSGTFGGN